jgi:tight adherence protein C
MPMLLVLALACLAGAAYVAAETIALPARERRRSLRRAAAYARGEQLLSGDRDSLRERALLPFKDRLASMVLRLNPRTTVESVSAKLLAAGLARRVSATGFLAGKGAFALAGFLSGIIFGTGAAGAGTGVFFAFAFAGAGFVSPDLLLSSRARKRNERIGSDLPDALDLLAVTVEAGLGFDAAIAKLVDVFEGPLAEEFGRTLGEIRIGETRQEALKKLAERVGTPEIGSFTRAVIQADQYGSSLGKILHVQAEDTRLRRQAAAEERAMKAPIKMLFPTVAFIFPAMFLVILGPAFLNLAKVI